jgi:hypothetical protein
MYSYNEDGERLLAKLALSAVDELEEGLMQCSKGFVALPSNLI